MGDAPEKIWAFYAPEIADDNRGCSIVAGEGPMYGAQPYIRADLHEARIRELEEALQDISVQRNTDEMSAEEQDVADFQGGFDLCIERARKALRALAGEGE